MGPSGRGARWHLKFSRFRLMVKYTPGKDNVVADGLSRWAYLASQAGPHVCWHRTQQDLEEMEKILAEERAEEWELTEDILALPALELHEALVMGGHSWECSPPMLKLTIPRPTGEPRWLARLTKPG